MKRSVSRPDLGDQLAECRDYFPAAVANVNETLQQRQLLDTMVSSVMDEARELLGLGSWFAPESRPMLESIRLQAAGAGLALERVIRRPPTTPSRQFVLDSLTLHVFAPECPPFRL